MSREAHPTAPSGEGKVDVPRPPARLEELASGGSLIIGHEI